MKFKLTEDTMFGNTLVKKGSVIRVADNVKMPRILYRNEISKYFDNDYATVVSLFDTSKGAATVQNDWGVWYDLVLNPKYTWHEARVNLKKTKLGKDGQPLNYL